MEETGERGAGEEGIFPTLSLCWKMNTGPYSKSLFVLFNQKNAPEVESIALTDLLQFRNR